MFSPKFRSIVVAEKCFLYIPCWSRGLLTSSMNGGGGGNRSFLEYRHSPAYMHIFPCMAVKRINFQRMNNDVNLKFSK